MNARLFERIKTVYDRKQDLTLTPEESYMLDNLYKSFVRNGALLSSEDQETLRKLNEEISRITSYNVCYTKLLRL